MDPLHARPGALTTLSVVAVAILSGCASRTESFSGYTDDQLWTAMVKAAESPDYPDWHVIENDVWAEPSARQIEVYRLLRRFRDPPDQLARMQDQEWKFSVTLKDTDPPKVKFVVRSFAVPAHAWDEENRYMKDLHSFLGAPATSRATEEPAPAPVDAPADATTVDVPN